MPTDALYFAYGSNLDPVQMQRRCPGSAPIEPAFAPGLALTFPVHSNGDWQGGVASIEPIASVPDREPFAHLDGVWGVLYRVTDRDIKSLDLYEAVDEGMYRRGTVDVFANPAAHTTEAAQTVLTYHAIRGYNQPSPPSAKYLDAIVRGAEHHHLPANYIVALRAIPTGPSPTRA